MDDTSGSASSVTGPLTWQPSEAVCRDTADDVLALTPSATQHPMTTTVTSTPNAWGAPGEQLMAFLYGVRGVRALVGPSGAAGKNSNAAGIDFLGVQYGVGPDGFTLYVADGKALGTTRGVSECSALTDNLPKNLDSLVVEVTALSDFPRKADVVARLRTLAEAVGSGGGLVDGVVFEISNAGGYAGPPTPALQKAFATASRLTQTDASRPDGVGPVPLGFFDTISSAERSARRDELRALGGNPRGDTVMTTTEPVPAATPGRVVSDAAVTYETVAPEPDLLSPAPIAMSPRGEAAVGVLELARLLWQVVCLVHPMPDQAAEAWPDAFSRAMADLAAHGGHGVLFVVVLEQTDVQTPLTDSLTSGFESHESFLRWEWQLGGSAEQAWGWWAAPQKIVADLPPRSRRIYRFSWFDPSTNRVSPYSAPRDF